MLGGIEPLWGFSCPLLLPEPARHANEFVDEVVQVPDWSRLVLTGLDAESDLYFEVIRALARIGTVYRADGIDRCVADLSQGVGPWLDRRSSRFRQQWRRRERSLAGSGIEIEVIDTAEGLMDRFLAIERRGWKGRRADGITSSAMEATYRHMIDRLGAAGRLRAAVARSGDRDVGFILGGVRGGIYRGLQLSYVEQVADLGVGHTLQAFQINALGPEIHTYDMGMDMEYKRRYADELRPSVVVILHR